MFALETADGLEALRKSAIKRSGMGIPLFYQARICYLFKENRNCQDILNELGWLQRFAHNVSPAILFRLACE